ncbi:hypothetical protein BCV72DRAFT_329674 [Rhizopus microsporus var. microsporus]|uniref:Uncharacterized protein n=1 Tax=Rhizopus microsporus var. microsporus TaxID=86635 RepID=A0A1X0RG68_RHIZD|nr:hypothetical protein BCV72DRAFT_329674 [Rhizopus microsporus var. microsporus]
MSEPSFPPANIVMNNSSSVSKSKKKRNKKKNKKAGSSQQSPAASVPPTEAVTQGVTGAEGTTGEFTSNDSLNQDEAAVTAPTTPEEQPKVTENVDHPEKIGAGEQGTVEQPEELGEQGTVEQPEELGGQETIEQPEELGEQETIEQPEELGGQGTVERPEELGEQGAVEQPEELGGQESTLMPPQRRDTDQDPSRTVPAEGMLPSAVTPDVPEKQEEIKAPGAPLVQTRPLAPIPVATPQLTERSAFQEPTSTVSPPLPSPFEPKETFPSSTEPFAMEHSYHELSDNEESCVRSAVQSKFIDIDFIMKQVKENIDKGMYETPRGSHGTFGTSDAVAAATSATGAMPASSTTTADTTTDENVMDDTTKSTVPVQEDTLKQPEPAVVNEQPTAMQPVTTATDTKQNVATTTSPTEQDNVPQPASANASQQAITDNAPQQTTTDNVPQQAVSDNAPQQPSLNDASQQPDSTVASRPPKPKRSSQIRSSIISAVKKRRSCIIL